MTPTLTLPTSTEPRSSTLAESTTANGHSPHKVSPTIETDLSLWLAALQSFLNTENLPTPEAISGRTAAPRDWTGEVRVTGWGLLKCSQFATGLRVSEEINLDALATLQKVLQESASLCESLAAQGRVDLTAWKAWCAILKGNLNESAAVDLLLDKYETQRNDQLPFALEHLSQHSELQGITGADVLMIIKRLCGLIERLRLIDKMLKRDQPLKPALLLFALLYKETRDLLAQAERTLTILPLGTPLQEVLDGVIYIIPMELRKVFTYELVGVGEMRQTPAVFARVENGCGLLKDCFQQAVVALAQVFSPALNAAEVFPNEKTKLEQSLTLRREIWLTLKTAQHVEKSLEPAELANFNAKLADFRLNTMPFLMFKDCETIERFIEEIARTHRNEEIAQVLHRFGAYLETLMGQVNMRNVLSNHPFDYPEANL